MSELADFITKAERFLKTAKLVLEDGDYASCLSRCYYAMYAITEALLLTKNITTSTHKGTISFFGKYFIRTGELAKEFGKILNEAYDRRLEGDYGVGLEITEADATEQLKLAEKYIKTMKDYLKEKKLLPQ
ncbi:MAG: HEPN domain-containing protein [Candidatus Heimdallarchaeota archaeon]